MSLPGLLSNPDPEKSPGTEPSLQRKITSTGAFWVSSGVPALVLFSIGAVVAAVGKPAWLVWTVSILFGFLQAFTYAEIAGLFPNKSGGASIYGATAWLRYSKFIAPLSVWCNWFAWSPVLAIGSGLTAGYVLLALFPADSPVHTWKVVLLDLGMLKDGLTIRLNATFLVGTAVMLLVFAVQHGGILRSAKATMLLGIVALVPLLVIGMVPILTGVSGCTRKRNRADVGGGVGQGQICRGADACHGRQRSKRSSGAFVKCGRVGGIGHHTSRKPHREYAFRFEARVHGNQPLKASHHESAGTKQNE